MPTAGSIEKKGFPDIAC